MIFTSFEQHPIVLGNLLILFVVLYFEQVSNTISLCHVAELCPHLTYNFYKDSIYPPRKNKLCLLSYTEEEVNQRFWA